MDPTYISKEEYDEKMGLVSSSFFDSLPDRPYITWTKPTSIVDFQTRRKTVYDQRTFLHQLNKDNTDLVDKTDITPVEYAVFQSRYTREIKRIKTKNNSKYPTVNIRPLDYREEYRYSFTRFLSVKAASFRHALFAFFDPIEKRINFKWGDDDIHSYHGFRPVARS